MLTTIGSVLGQTKNTEQRTAAVKATVEPLPRKVSVLMKGAGGEPAARVIHDAVGHLDSARTAITSAHGSTEDALNTIRGSGNF